VLACSAPEAAKPAVPGNLPSPALAAGCRAPEYRALDFWIGEWDVHDPGGALIGSNEIAPILGGCAVRETWTDRRGQRGESLFTFDRARRRWTQSWGTRWC
jgi:hypothetical protein